MEALRRSGADGVMIGRGCYGRPWFLAQVAHFLRTGSRLPEPPLAAQKDILTSHYHAILQPFRRPRRGPSGAQARILVLARPAWFGGIPRGDEPAARCRIGPAADRCLLRPADRPRRDPNAARARRRYWRKRHDQPGHPRGAGLAGSEAGSRRGADSQRAAGARRAARSGRPVPLRQSCRGAVPRHFDGGPGTASPARPGSRGQPLVPAGPAGPPERCHRVGSRPEPGEPAAQQAGHHRAGLVASRGTWRGAAGPAGRLGGPCARPAACVPRRRAQRHRDGGHPRARGEEPALRHSRCSAIAGNQRGRPGSRTCRADPRRGRPDPRAGRPDGDLRREADRPHRGEHPSGARTCAEAGAVGLRAARPLPRGV